MNALKNEKWLCLSQTNWKWLSLSNVSARAVKSPTTSEQGGWKPGDVAAVARQAGRGFNMGRSKTKRGSHNTLHNLQQQGKQLRGEEEGGGGEREGEEGAAEGGDTPDHTFSKFTPKHTALIKVQVPLFMGGISLSLPFFLPLVWRAGKCPKPRSCVKWWSIIITLFLLAILFQLWLMQLPTLSVSICTFMWQTSREASARLPFKGGLTNIYGLTWSHF